MAEEGGWQLEAELAKANNNSKPRKQSKRRKRKRRVEARGERKSRETEKAGEKSEFLHELWKEMMKGAKAKKKEKAHVQRCQDLFPLVPWSVIVWSETDNSRDGREQVEARRGAAWRRGRGWGERADNWGAAPFTLSVSVPAFSTESLREAMWEKTPEKAKQRRQGRRWYRSLRTQKRQRGTEQKTEEKRREEAYRKGKEEGRKRTGRILEPRDNMKKITDQTHKPERKRVTVDVAIAFLEKLSEGWRNFLHWTVIRNKLKVLALFGDWRFGDDLSSRRRSCREEPRWALSAG